MPVVYARKNKTLKRTAGHRFSNPNKKVATEEDQEEDKSLLRQYIIAVSHGPDHHHQLDVQQVLASVADMDPKDILASRLLDELDSLIANHKFAAVPLCTIKDALSKRVHDCEDFISVAGTKHIAQFVDSHLHLTLSTVATARILLNLEAFSDEDTIDVLKFVLDRISCLQLVQDMNMDGHCKVLQAIGDRWIPAMETFVQPIFKILHGAPNVRATKIVATVIGNLSVQQLIDLKVFDLLTCERVKNAWQFYSHIQHLLDLIKDVDTKISSVDPHFVPRQVVQVIKLLDIQLPHWPQYKSYCIDLCERLRHHAFTRYLRSFFRDTIVDNQQPDNVRVIYMDMYIATLGFESDETKLTWSAVENFCQVQVPASLSFQYGVFLTRMIKETAENHEPRTVTLAKFMLTTMLNIPNDPVFARVLQLMEQELCAAIEALLDVDVADEMVTLVCATLRRTRSHSNNMNETASRMLAMLRELGSRQCDRTQCMQELHDLTFYLVNTNGDPTLFALTLDELGNLLVEISLRDAGTWVLRLFKILMDLPPGTNTQALVEFVAFHLPTCLFQRDVTINQLAFHVRQMAYVDDSVDYRPLMHAIVNVPVAEPLPEVRASRSSTRLCWANRV